MYVSFYSYMYNNYKMQKWIHNFKLKASLNPYIHVYMYVHTYLNLVICAGNLLVCWRFDYHPSQIEQHHIESPDLNTSILNQY